MMVGNDVVDILDPESEASSLSERFDVRVFRASERDRIAVAPDSSRMRWRLWAAKEAAYKALRQDDPRIPFSPIRFEVELSSAFGEASSATPHSLSVSAARTTGRGQVEHRGCRLLVRFEEDARAVHAVASANSDGGQRLVYGFALAGDLRARASEGDRSPDAPSRAAREFATSELESLFGASPGALEVRKRGRVPNLHRGGMPLSTAFSLSHHGALVAFAAIVPEAELANGIGKERAA